MNFIAQSISCPKSEIENKDRTSSTPGGKGTTGAKTSKKNSTNSAHHDASASPMTTWTNIAYWSTFCVTIVAGISGLYFYTNKYS